jgi:hypothetical protein
MDFLTLFMPTHKNTHPMYPPLHTNTFHIFLSLFMPTHKDRCTNTFLRTRFAQALLTLPSTYTNTCTTCSDRRRQTDRQTADRHTFTLTIKHQHTYMNNTHKHTQNSIPEMLHCSLHTFSTLHITLRRTPPHYKLDN